jgi:membrane protein DedA with SNARE-associated domain
MLKRLLGPLLGWYLGALKTLGYPAVALLMFAESSFLPIPSEAIIPFAANCVGKQGFSLSYTGIVVAGALGSWLGATVMYWLARMAGRPLVLRYGKFVLFPPEKLEKAESWMSHYGPMGVFVARLLPGARQLVGIPAGIAKFKYLQFSLYTLLGATIWCSVLCYVGVKAGQDEGLMKGDLRDWTIWLGGAAIVLGALYYFFVHRHLQKKPERGIPEPEAGSQN